MKKTYSIQLPVTIVQVDGPVGTENRPTFIAVTVLAESMEEVAKGLASAISTHLFKPTT